MRRGMLTTRERRSRRKDATRKGRAREGRGNESADGEANKNRGSTEVSISIKGDHRTKREAGRPDRYDINEDVFKNSFRSSKQRDGETNRDFAVRMMDSLTKWLKECKTVNQVHLVLGTEQFLSSLPVEKRLWLV